MLSPQAPPPPAVSKSHDDTHANEVDPRSRRARSARAQTRAPSRRRHRREPWPTRPSAAGVRPPPDASPESASAFAVVGVAFFACPRNCRVISERGPWTGRADCPRNCRRRRRGENGVTFEMWRARVQINRGRDLCACASRVDAGPSQGVQCRRLYALHLHSGCGSHETERPPRSNLKNQNEKEVGSAWDATHPRKVLERKTRRSFLVEFAEGDG